MSTTPFGTLQRRVLDRVNSHPGICELRLLSLALNCSTPAASRAVHSLVRRGELEPVPLTIHEQRGDGVHDGRHVRFARRRSRK